MSFDDMSETEGVAAARDAVVGAFARHYDCPDHEESFGDTAACADGHEQETRAALDVLIAAAELDALLKFRQDWPRALESAIAEAEAALQAAKARREDSMSRRSAT